MHCIFKTSNKALIFIHQLKLGELLKAGPLLSWSLFVEVVSH